ncbi:hypothetical protein EIP86_008935 [Pleurotus ostreatoroseus]|nr:hypothetical protein EIP86_008935 [Pleurotus ostreatoroseus]
MKIERFRRDIVNRICEDQLLEIQRRYGTQVCHTEDCLNTLVTTANLPTSRTVKDRDIIRAWWDDARGWLSANFKSACGAWQASDKSGKSATPRRFCPSQTTRLGPPQPRTESEDAANVSRRDKTPNPLIDVLDDTMRIDEEGEDTSRIGLGTVGQTTLHNICGRSSWIVRA